MYSLRTITPPTVEPIALETLRDHLRLDSSDEDDILVRYLRGARAALETTCDRAFMPQTLSFGIDRFPWNGYDYRNRSYASRASSMVPDWVDRTTIRLPRPGCLDVLSITYLNPAGEIQTLDPDTYVVDLESEPARTIPTNGFCWPIDAFFIPGSVKIKYLAGSYALPAVDSVTAKSDGGAACTVALLSQPAGGPMSLADSAGNAVSFTLGPGAVLTLADASLNDQQLTATYYAKNVPPNVEIAMLLTAAHWYRNREAASDTLMKEIPMGVRELIAPEIFYGGGAIEL